MNGWIVDHELTKLIKPSFHSLRDLVSIRREDILSQPLNYCDDFFETTSKSAIVLTKDEQIFKKLSSALYEFCEMRDGSVHLMVPRIVEKYQQQIMYNFEARCDKINLGGRNVKYLRLVASQGGEPESDTSWGMNKGYSAFHLEKYNSVFSKDIGVQQFKFTEEDYSVLNGYMPFLTDYKCFGQKYLNHAYIKAQKNGVNHLNADIEDGVTALVKKLSADTVDKYGHRLGPSFFLLLHVRKLSSFLDLTFYRKIKLNTWKR